MPIRIIESGYIPVEARRLLPDLPIPFDVYAGEESEQTQLFTKGSVFTQEARQLLIRTGTETVYVPSYEKSALEQYLSGAQTFSRKSSYSDPLEFRKAALNKEQYYQVNRQSFKPGTTVDFSLYNAHGFDVSLLVGASEKSPAVLEEAALGTGNDIVINKADIPRYRAYVSSGASDLQNGRTILAKEEGKIAIKELFENPNDEVKINAVAENVETIIDQIFDNNEVLYGMLSMQNKTYYVYTHSINVAVLSLGLGSSIGLTSDKLIRLGIGAALHDVGMSAISPEISNKQGNLTYAEYAILKMHVAEGEKLLRGNKNIPEESLYPVSQHHEKLSGKGYPNKLKGDDIKLFGRITAIADAYDSLVTTRPYRQASKPFDALSILAKEQGSYDPELLRSFIRLLGKAT